MLIFRSKANAMAIIALAIVYYAISNHSMHSLD